MAETITLALHIPKKQHVALIGREGSVVKRLQSEFKVRVLIPDRASTSSVVEVKGTSADAAAARQEIEKILGYKVSSEPLSVFEVRVECKRHGALIGKGGSTLRTLESQSGCGITVPSADSGDECVLIEGSKDGANVVREAMEKLVSAKLTLTARAASSSSGAAAPPGGAALTQESKQAAGAASKPLVESKAGSHLLFIPKRAQFEIVGPGGATIHKLQEKHGVRIRMPKLEDPSTEVTIEGTGAQAEAVRRDISQLLGFSVGSDPLVTVYLDIPSAHYGRIIGTEGTILRSIEAKTACAISIPRRSESKQLVELSGSQTSVDAGQAEIERILGQSFKAVAGVKAEQKPQSLVHIDLSKPINEALFFPEKHPDGPNFNRFVGFLSSATRSLDVCVFTITDGRVAAVLRNAHQNGVVVRIITDNDTAAAENSDIESLRKAGVPIKFDKSEFFMHNKFAVIDGKMLQTGSYNWSRAANLHNQENIIFTNQVDLVRQFQTRFEAMWADKENFTTDWKPSAKKPFGRD